jgi:hypothetical protein
MSYLLSAWDNEGRINTALVQEPAHLNNPTPASTQLTRSIYIYIYISPEACNQILFLNLATRVRGHILNIAIGDP